MRLLTAAFLCTLIFSYPPLNGQTDKRLAVVLGSQTKYIPVYEREDVLYIPVLHFADALSMNYYINEQTDKIEIKFPFYTIKISPANPFFIISSKKTGDSEVYQIPTSTYLLNGFLYIPLRYSLEILNSYSNFDFSYESKFRIIAEKKEGGNDFTTEDSTQSSLNGFDVTGLILEEKANGTLVKLVSNKRIPSYYSSFSNGILTLVFREVNTDPGKINISGESELINKIDLRNSGKDLELKFYLRAEYTANEVLNVEGSNDILITLHNKIFSSPVDKNIEKWNFDVIVIDAGHGGVDGGTVGVNGLLEKDVNLKIALKLGKLIEDNMKDVKVVYTRKTDKAVDLHQRGKIANENDGKLFISIHCNSTNKKPSDANGFEVYLLRPGRTQEAIEIAERENSVIRYEENPERYQKLTDENFILVSMAHSSYMKYSEKLAEMLDKEFRSKSKLKTRGVKQAGFYVLVGASMPGVLIETGFISNPDDAAYLKSEKGQTEVAKSIFESIKKFRDYYEKQLDSET
ncbi:MAG: hypothetical protein Kow0098_00930 [Ignavibacteriaceae bacterium]